ncbi:hypothetical protein ACLK14_17520 [Escherichia coli]
MRKEMNEFPVVLVINCGSLPIKFSVLDASDCEVLMSGIADGINSENAFLSVKWGRASTAGSPQLRRCIEGNCI